MTTDEHKRHARRIQEILYDAPELRGGDSDPKVNDMLQELIEALASLSCGDLTAGDQATSASARAVNFAVGALAERITPVRDAVDVAKEASQTALKHLLVHSDDDDNGRLEREPRHERLLRHLDVTKARMAELSHLAIRLGEIGGQAQVAALNVAIEVSRDGVASQDTLTTFADEVRRFAERVDAVAQRVIVVVQKVQGAHCEVLDAIDGESTSNESTIDSARRLERALDDLTQQFEERFALPSFGSRYKRVAELRGRLDDELRRLASDDETSQEIDDALDQLEGLLSGPLGRREPEEVSQEDGST